MLFRDFAVRPAREADLKQVQKLVKTIDLNANLLSDLQQYYKSHRDDVATFVDYLSQLMYFI